MFKKDSKHYMWVIVAICFLIEFLVLGFCSGSKKLFLGPITSALGLERSLFGLNDTCRYVCTAVMALFFGPLMSRFGTKKLVLTGFGVLSLSMTCYAFATNIFMFCVGGCLLGIGMGLTTSTIITAVIRSWCKGPHAGKLLGLVLGANGIGGAAATILLTPIITASEFGYRNAYLLIVPLLIITAILTAIFLCDPPEGAGATPQKKKARGNTWVGIEYSVLKHKAFFYVALVAVFLTGMMLQGSGSVDKAHLIDVGIDEAFVTGIMSLSWILLTASKFLCGTSYDKFGLRITVLFCDLLAVLSMLFLALATPSVMGKAFAFLHYLVTPFALPLETVMLSLIANDLFGDASFNKVLGIVTAVNYAGYAVSSPLINLCYDMVGTYSPILYGFAVMMLVVAVIFQYAVTASHKERKALAAQ